MAGHMNLEGMEELMLHIQSLDKKVDDALRDKALREGAEFLRDKIQHHPNMPRSDAHKEHAQDHIIVKKATDDTYEVGPEERFFYLQFHELGARGGTYKSKAGNSYTLPGIDAKPFMRPAFETNTQEIQARMAKVIKRGLGI